MNLAWIWPALVLLGALMWVASTVLAYVRRTLDRYHAATPDAVRVLQELDAHLDEYVCEDRDLWEAFGRGSNWDIQQGLDRLRDAIRDEQHKGDQ